ncbi:hypothetical protein L218DRAFT_1056808, partial [Marasmius fiardii PR-910]
VRTNPPKVRCQWGSNPAIVLNTTPVGRASGDAGDARSVHFLPESFNRPQGNAQSSQRGTELPLRLPQQAPQRPAGGQPPQLRQELPRDSRLYRPKGQGTQMLCSGILSSGTEVRRDAPTNPQRERVKESSRASSSREGQGPIQNTRMLLPLKAFPLF